MASTIFDFVADELERRWNSALTHVESLRQRIDTLVAERAKSPDCSVDEFIGLAEELEQLWRSPQVNARLKKRLVRTLIEEVVADVDSVAGEIILQIHWKGGTHTELRLPRRRRGHACVTSSDVVAAVKAWAHRACRRAPAVVDRPDGRKYPKRRRRAWVG